MDSVKLDDRRTAVVGDRVFTINLRWGTIARIHSDGWCDVLEDGKSQPTLLNGTRMSSIDRMLGSKDPHAKS